MHKINYGKSSDQAMRVWSKMRKKQKNQDRDYTLDVKKKENIRRNGTWVRGET